MAMRSRSAISRLSIGGASAAVHRSDHRRKAQKLAEAGPLAYGWAETRSERLAVLETAFAQKARQLAALGIANPFDAGVRAFYRELALLDDDNPSRLRLGYLTAGDTIAATFNGFARS